jgi:hypothetical protein
MWTAVQSTIFRTLAYPLPALNLSKKEWDGIMSPLLATVLPRLGICRHFPRAMVFIPVKVFGLGFQHLYTLQEITRMKDLVYHTANNTITGHLLPSIIRALAHRVGIILTSPLYLLLHLRYPSYSIFDQKY